MLPPLLLGLIRVYCNPVCTPTVFVKKIYEILNRYHVNEYRGTRGVLV